MNPADNMDFYRTPKGAELLAARLRLERTARKLRNRERYLRHYRRGR